MWSLRQMLILLLVLQIAALNVNADAAGKQRQILGYKDLKLCMTYAEFSSGPSHSFSRNIVHGNPIMPGIDQVSRIETLESVRGRVETSVWFGEGNRLAEIRLRIPPYTSTPQQFENGGSIYTFLRGEMQRTYALRPEGPILAVESQLPGISAFLLIDEQGNSLSLEHLLGTDGFVQLSFFARGTERSPVRNAARLLLGRDVKFCEPER